MTTMPDGPLAEEPEARPSSPEEAVLREAESVLEDVAPEAEASMDVLDSPRRLLLVHAHPDDETIGNGATMARYAASGTHVTLVTCTLGEEGEVLVPELTALAADQEDGLGQHRVGELATAMEALGVTDHRFLGGPGRFRDSGMMGLPTNDRPDCFWQADVDEAARLLVEVVREVRPQVLVTYDENGGYGHPDHIQAHRVAMRALEMAADPQVRDGEPWQVEKVYWNAIPDSWLREGMRRLREAGDETTFEGMDPEGELPMATPDELVTTAVDATDFVDAKLAAMRAHATQIAVDGPFFALSNNLGNAVWGVEHYRLVRGEVAGDRDQNGRETDLFGGLD
ncbi:MAG: N-acetyl-D-myo-inositol-2-amino-2-deoxy-alpha-D-glucopyranoside deacetylase [Actinomycetota bacterium]|jgi:N-acetyl-1-D-myo-inositol-2-amino-2-deoxy-alpha-D-glucopyranoside deacetylase|nr:N-acetyl-D-myo-inositol-2-amino-2-deoxy-alpha-D-glucopyranoside deacetylase [Actinomycetota bacterium]MDQ1664256.1 N-acetyl-D-myo-inositol-2-amino-2-deoxy-alpha-D-glucopyranoside deacetylase [Actinomycetota bacterium]